MKAFAVAFIASIFAFIGYAAVTQDERQVVEFNAPTAPAAVNPANTARDHATRHGLTSCAVPEDAELDDVFLTLEADPTTGQATSTRVTELGLDDALNTDGDRLVVLACKEKP